ncbi:hypothetical protein DID77_03900 [Candidatus Marinamargulisbacteria bacterium SCGC AG-439-L15]|nr:hypothetical protein DID77_03900 [Candidatus Marinamargulisbacteria bacterium SCGC AG-439-L15]
MTGYTISVMPALDHFLYLDFFLKSVIAIVFGYIIGYERQTKKKPAGIKTHSLICLGASILTFLSIHFSTYGDPSRIAAQIVSGIGFIGAGTIFMSKQRVQGLTSAATVWVSSAIGMLIGAGFIFFAFISTCLIVVLFYILSPKKLLDTHPYSISIEIEDYDSLPKVSKLLTKYPIQVHHKAIERRDIITLQMTYHTTPFAQHLFSKSLLEIEGLGDILKI